MEAFRCERGPKRRFVSVRCSGKMALKCVLPAWMRRQQYRNNPNVRKTNKVCEPISSSVASLSLLLSCSIPLPHTFTDTAICSQHVCTAHAPCTQACIRCNNYFSNLWVCQDNCVGFTRALHDPQAGWCENCYDIMSVRVDCP